MEYKRCKCAHCNNDTLMEIRDKNKVSNGDISSDSYYYDLQVVLLCPTCKNYNIINAYWDNTCGKIEESIQYEDIYGMDNVYETTLYPISSNILMQGNIIPAEILRNFKKSLELRTIDEESCLVKLRKTLELICRNQSASGHDLSEMISDLFSKGVLPKTLKSASTITRKLGNLGAHESNVEITTNELESDIKMVEYIIQYIYILPNEIERLEKRINL